MESREVGDDVPHMASGFRFYTTHNKGIAVVLTWFPVKGEEITGAIHMPGYPLFDWKQDSRWQPPDGPDVRFWLHLSTPLHEDRAWTLRSDYVSGVLVVNTQGRRIELKRGEQVNLDGGTLRFDELRGWMGYRIFFDPTLPWLLGAAIAAVFGLAIQFWRQSSISAHAVSTAPLSGTQAL
jgi:cytochrome c biogenesis protein